MGIPIDIVFQRGWLETAIMLGVEFAINMPFPFTAFSDDYFMGFLALTWQRMLGSMAEEASVEDMVNFHRLGKVSSITRELASTRLTGNGPTL